jgi:hypothetical protein
MLEAKTMRKFRQFIAGLIVGAMLFSTVTVFAGTQTIEAFFNNIKISIDGEAVVLTDVSGNPVEPFIYEGTTYAPIRAIAQALGMEVKYNETTNTVELAKAKEDKKVEFNPANAKESIAHGLNGVTVAGFFYVPINEIEKNNNIKIEQVDDIYIISNIVIGEKVEVDPNTTMFGNWAIPKSIELNNMTYILYDSIDKLFLSGEEQNNSPQPSWKFIKEGGTTIHEYKDGTKYIAPSDIRRSVFLDGKDKDMLTSFKIDEESKTVTFYYKENVVVDRYPLFYVSGNLYLIPYDDYKFNILPKLLEAIKQNQ